MEPSSPRATQTGDVPPGQLPAESDAPGRSGVRSAVEWVVIVAAALLTALLIKTFLLQAFYIPSDSMNPTLVVHDRVLVNKLSYHFHDVHRGDIVVFKRPPGEDDPRIKDLIKRVVALPGDTVEGRNGQVLIDGRALTEPYIPKGTQTSDFSAEKIPSGKYWVMGDNRGNSKDSRVFGPISKSLIVGRAFIRVWPISKISLL
ncbi:MAG: signal peptidase [Acidimicrobiales bacterium]|nr:signal peptidase [Acidimicrobiales bacterium]